MGISLVILLFINNRYDTYVDGFSAVERKVKYAEMSALMDPVLLNIEDATEIEEKVINGRHETSWVYLTYKFDNPSDILLKQIILNIDSESYWKEVTDSNDYEYDNWLKSYCYDQYTLSISKPNLQFKNSNSESHHNDAIQVAIDWYDANYCYDNS